MLPGEGEHREKLQRELEGVVVVGQTLLALAIEILTKRTSAISIDSSNAFAFRIGHGLCAKACKSLRSSLALAEIGAADDLTVLSRMLFETYVAASFVLRDRVKLDLPDVDDEALGSNDRARIYAAFTYINRHEELKRHMADPATAAVLAGIDQQAVTDNANVAENEVGPKWAERFRKRPRTYSGLSLGALARKLGPEYAGWYAKVYGEQSKPVHATDFQKHIAYSDQEQRFLFTWFAPVEQVASLAAINSLMLVGCLDLLNTRFRFNENTDEDLGRVMALLAHTLRL